MSNEAEDHVPPEIQLHSWPIDCLVGWLVGWLVGRLID